MKGFAAVLFSWFIFFSPLSLSLAAAEQSVDDLLKQGSYLQQQGFFRDAQAAYQIAYQLAANAKDEKQQALSQAALGYSEYLLNHLEKAQPLLEQALHYAEKNQHNGLLALSRYYLGLLHQAQNRKEIAQSLLLKSLATAESLADPVLIARIQIALANTATDRQQLLKYQQSAVQTLKTIKKANITGELYLLLVEQGLNNALFPNLATDKGKAANQHLAYLYQLLQLAKSNLGAQQSRQLAKYYALKAQLYQSQQRTTEALTLIHQAIQKLHGENAQDQLMFYEWQAGNLYKALQKNELAIESYRRAVSYVQAIRQDIPVRYNDGKSSFLELFGPLYRGLIELLLDQAGGSEDTASKTTLLTEVQAVLERLKQSELEDFFKDRCLLTDFNHKQLAFEQNKIAILYPVILSRRLELLLKIGEQFYQYTVPVSAGTFETTVRSYAAGLREGIEESSNQQLYDWLIRPISEQLEQHQVETLVYIPDGVLRLLPIASLHDGRQYLIERYALSTLPSLTILSTGKTNASTTETLLVGLSTPTAETVANLPKQLLQTFFSAPDPESSERGLRRNGSVRSISANFRALADDDALPTEQLNLEELAQALTLPGVKDEIKLLAEKLPNRTILDQDYTLNNFEQLATLPKHRNIHIASHGFFGGTSDASFIMTYDRLLTIDHLENLLTARGAQAPIDLIVLSACQTAEGDDRAPLGLSGIALKAKARSALGSLWPISDQAAVEIMKEFYIGFIQQGLTKAKALQQAQVKLLKHKELNHPFYWSPFVLVGHW